MKMICDRKGLLSACSIASMAVSDKVRDVLKHFKFSASEDACTLMATNAELGVRTELEGVQISKPGSTLFPADRILSILQEMPDDQVTMEATAKRCVLRGQGNEFAVALKEGDVAAFPEVPMATKESYAVRSDILRDMIRKVAFSISLENSDFVKRFGAGSGVLWSRGGSELSLVATTGRVLAIAHANAVNPQAYSKNVVLAKGLVLLRKVLDTFEPDGPESPEAFVKVGFGGQEALFVVNQTTISSRLVEGLFPSYQKIIPDPPSAVASVELNVGEFTRVVRLVAILENGSEGALFQFGRTKLSLSTIGQRGKASVEMPIDLQGEDTEARLNPAQLKSMLGAFKAQDVLRLHLFGFTQPVLFSADGFTCVISQMAG